MADRGGIDALLYLMDEAFRGPGIEDSTRARRSSRISHPWPRQRGALPSGGARSIENIALHIGACKVMYDDYAFGSGTMFWDQEAVQPWPEGEAPMAEAVRWLEAGYARLAEHVAALADDAELAHARVGRLS